MSTPNSTNLDVASIIEFGLYVTECRPEMFPTKFSFRHFLCQHSLLHRSLRDEETEGTEGIRCERSFKNRMFQVIAGLSTADLTLAFAYFVSGIYRLDLLFGYRGKLRHPLELPLSDLSTHSA